MRERVKSEVFLDLGWIIFGGLVLHSMAVWRAALSILILYSYRQAWRNFKVLETYWYECDVSTTQIFYRRISRIRGFDIHSYTLKLSGKYISFGALRCFFVQLQIAFWFTKESCIKINIFRYIYQPFPSNRWFNSFHHAEVFGC